MNNNGYINLKYYKENKGHGNFGDEMSPILISKITNRKVINSSNSNEQSIIAIGSYIMKANNDDYIWGSGIRTLDQECNYTRLNVKAVRGPLTQRYLEDKGIDVPNIYGDPALLYTKIFDIKKNVNYLGKIGLIPHFTQLEKYHNFDLPNNIKIISPIEPVNDVLSNIKSCKYIISSSLHGLIIADSFDIPNFWLYEDSLDEGKLKFHDYFLSQNKQIKEYNSIDAIMKSNCHDYGNKINLNLLLNSFPNELIKV